MKPYVRNFWLVLGVFVIGVMIATQMFARIEAENLYHPEETQFANPSVAIEKSQYSKRIREVDFEAIDGTRLNGWHVPAPQDRPTILYAHGNGGNIGDRWDILDAFVAQDFGFFMFDYRGFGKSGGKPSEEGLYKDIEAASYYLETQKVPVSEQIAVGASLGGAVVIDAATRLPFKAVAVHSTFTSAPAVAGIWKDNGRMEWLNTVPVHRVMKQQYDSLSKIGQVKSPLLVAHRGQDEMIPLDMAFDLFDAATSARHKMLAIQPGSEHSVSPDVIIEYLNKLMAQDREIQEKQ